ncbi:hypothetical protein EVAR_47231_1 [Eumeta japonica]|uniref:Uncharacterized protein n=1 Tax=Eumeta variegata TaxID=151549 RepID=A0A4C1XNX0_EUMVA|nr:hypothetical protein EVAR_47231_1 [Eumeta japonica]
MAYVQTSYVARRTSISEHEKIIKCTLDKFTSTMKYRWFDFSAEQSQEEPDLIKMARFLEREAERCSAYTPPETVTQPKEDTIT